VTQANQDAEDAGSGPSTQLLDRSNDTFPWDSFDSEWYLEHNYGTLEEYDRELLGHVADFFGGIRRTGLGHGIDVGTGTNLYPILAMLPKCGHITLRERSASNYRWLRNEVDKYSPVWDQYWDELAHRPTHKPIGDPRWAVHERTHVERRSIFDLPKDTYDLGTMFFVAESITERRDEFMRATRCFLNSLKLFAPFAAAFMINSSGYEVNGVHFPAVAITEDDVRRCLHGIVARDMNVQKIASGKKLREGVGMVLVTGKVVRR